MIAWVLTIAWPFIKAYKNLFIYGAIALLVAGGLIWVHHDGYEKGKASQAKTIASLKVDLANEKEIHQHDVDSYREAQDAVKEFNARLVAKKDAIIKNQLEKYVQKSKQLTELQKQRAVKVNSVVGVAQLPVSFRLLYNSAVSDHPEFGGPTTEAKDRSEVSSEVESLDARTFTQVMVGNANKYNSLAARCDALVDIVKEEENATGTNDSKP